MTFTAQAQAHFANGDLEALERLLDRAAQSRVENRPGMPSTDDFNAASDLLAQLKEGLRYGAQNYACG